VGRDLREYVLAHLARRAEEQRALSSVTEQAWEAARQAAERIGACVGAKRVLVFGSLVRGRFVRGSDLDLAVDGLEPGRLVDALAAAEADCPFPIDVVPLDAVRPDIANDIADEGIVLWSR
jgi:predicted nucleotidyltransferase